MKSLPAIRYVACMSAPWGWHPDLYVGGIKFEAEISMSQNDKKSTSGRYHAENTSALLLVAGKGRQDLFIAEPRTEHTSIDDDICPNHR